MILTVTANSALDRVIFIDEFRPTTVMRPFRVLESVGGKGLDTSVALQGLGIPNLALAFVAGRTGERLVQCLEAYGIRHGLVWADGETRIAHVIVERLHHRHSHIIIPGYRVSPSAWHEFLRVYETSVPDADWVVIAGSLPEGVPADGYHALTTIARRFDVPVLIDCPGPPVLLALPARPAIVKMNREEFRDTLDLQAAAPEDLGREASSLRQQHNLTSVVITLGAEGVLVSTAEGSFLATCPRQEAVNAAGAGDAVSAALAWRLSAGDPWPEALRWAAAAGAAVVLTEATAECRLEDAQRLRALVDVKRL